MNHIEIKVNIGAAGNFTVARTDTRLALVVVPLSRIRAEGDHGQASEQPVLIPLSFLSFTSKGGSV